jgi:hypothetical protein
MMNLEDIENAVQQLSSDELAKFRAWFENFEASLFDRRIEDDIKCGRLADIAERVIGEYHANASELQGIDRGLRDAAEGKFASDAEVQATFSIPPRRR